MSRANRTRLWAFALSAAACMLLLCLAHQTPALLGRLATTTATQPAVLPTAGTAPAAETDVEPTLAPDSVPLPTATPRAIVTQEPTKLTIVYDNYLSDARLRTGWGFACWIEVGGVTILFDTGADGPTLLGNLAALGLNPGEIELVVLSHAHDDHTGGLEALLGVNDHLTVFMPAAFPEELKARARERAALVEVEGPLEITEGVWSLGPRGASPVEHSLAIQGAQGVVVITGCAHPGIVAVVSAAREMDRIHLVLGGFHLGGKSAAEIELVISQLQELEVDQIAPCHCTGDLAISMFAAAFGEAYIQTGAGTVLQIPR